MPQYTKNSLPKNTLQDDSSSTVSEPKEKKKSSPSKAKQEENLNPQTSRMEKISQVVGVFSLLMAFFLFVAIISFLINWFTGDADDIFSGVGFSRILSDKTLEANNLGGRLGAATSILLVKQGFGIGSLFIPIWLFILGVRLTLKQDSSFWLWHGFRLRLVLFSATPFCQSWVVFQVLSHRYISKD